jgi:hypothetical protein
MEAVSIAYSDEETFMQVQTVLPASAVVPAVQVQIASTPTAPAPPAQLAHTVQPAPPVPTTSHAPVCPIPPVLPPEAAQMARPSKPTVPAPPAPTTPHMAVSEHSAPAGSVTTVEEPLVESTPEEVQLTQEIDQLWNAPSRAQGSLRKSREDAAKIRADLSVRLHQLKKVLSRPGRGGAWFSFLKAQAIPRSSADRLVKAHEKKISEGAGNCPFGASKPEAAEVVVGRYLNGLWPKLSRVLTTREHVEVFIAALRQTADKSLRVDDQLPSQAVSSSALRTEPLRSSLTTLHGVGPR